MIEVLIESIILASSGLLSVGSMTLTILLLISDRGLINGLGYAFGYIIGYSIIGILSVFFQYRTTGGSPAEPSLIPYYILIFLGGLLLYLSLKNYRKESGDSKDNRMVRMVDNITPLRAFGFGLLVTVVNFKNFALFMTALSVVLLSDLVIQQKLIITEILVLVFSSSVLIPIIIYLLFPKQGRNKLLGIKDWLNRNGRPISIWAPLAFGSIFIIKGVLEII
ncbi:MAG: GAP family protein [Candidatus Heimdallarchaeota archaeon]|nr:GAP family protein [Candidatus Heimdallarchaeota archaeon]